MSKLLSKKSMIICWIISLALIIAGAVVVGVAGFNPDKTQNDSTVVEVSDIAFASHDEKLQNELVDFCRDTISKTLKVKDVQVYENENTGSATLQYTVTGEMPTAEYCESVRKAVADQFPDRIAPELITVVSHQMVHANHFEYINRTAIAVAVGIAVLFIYAAIRFRLGMGFAVLLASIHDVLLMLALVALVRVPSGVVLAGVVAFTLLLSATFNLYIFGRVRRNSRSDEMKDLPVSEVVSLSVRKNSTHVYFAAIALAVLAVVLGIVGAVIGFDLVTLMIASLIGILVSVYSSLVLSPALYAAVGANWKAKHSNKKKYNAAKEKDTKKSEDVA